MSSLACDSSAVDQYLQELSNREIERTRRLQIENTRREIPFKVLKFVGIGLALAIVLWAFGKAFENANSFHQITEYHGTPNQGYENYSSNNDNDAIRQSDSGGDYIIDIDELLNTTNNEPIDHNYSDSDEHNNSEIFEVQQINTSNSIAEAALDKDASNNSIDTISDIAKTEDKKLEEEPEKFPDLEEPKPVYEGIRNYVIFDKVEFDGEVIKKVVTGRSYPDMESDVLESWCYVDNQNYESMPSIYLINISNGTRTDAEVDDELAKEFGASIEEINLAKTKCTI